MYPQNLHPQHLAELVEHSGIDLHLAHLNFTSLEDSTAYQYLLISENLPRTNIGMVNSSWLQRYSHVSQGGWWCAGVDPLNNWQSMEWGCFKPNHPRLNHKGKAIKYEHPPVTPTRVFCLRVTLQIWQQVSQRYHIAMPEDITLAAGTEAVGFWQWVMAHNLPVVICEGAKKAAALLSCGYVAIAIPGITSSYRVAKDRFGNIKNRQLIPDLLAFAVKKRPFYICFDYETQPLTLRAVNNAIAQLGYLLQEKNCPVKVVELPGLEKGVDEFLVAKGAGGFERLYHKSVDLEIYLALSKPHSELTIKPTLTCHRRYLENIPFPTSGLVGIKSAKGTGKTTALKAIVNQAKASNQSVLLITHRIQLGRFLCEKVGVQWGLGTRDWGLGIGEQLPITQSLGICVDSLWKLNPNDWRGGVVILDEIEQSLWHLLNSSTCKEKRVKILKVFQELICNVLTTGGLVIAQDADLSDLSLKYLQGLVGGKVTPEVIINQWQAQRGWDVTFYDSPNPTPLIHQLEIDLLAGRKCYVTTDSRSGRYSCETIELYIKERLEFLRKEYPKTLVISSKTTSTPGHDAVDFVAEINAKVSTYNAVFVTPSLGTGVSIDVKHFDRVYGIFQGVISDSEARQALARVRDSVPRIIWCAKRGIGLIGSGSTNYRLLSNWYQENQKENLALLSPLHRIDVDLPLVYDPIHLRTWAQFAARINASITLYRQSMKEGLIAEGHQVNIRSNSVLNNILSELRQAFLAADPQDTKTRYRLIREIVKVQNEWQEKSQKDKLITQRIIKIKRQNQWIAAVNIANAKNLDHLQYDNLLGKRNLSDDERNQIKKYVLQQRYCIEITPHLVLKDEKGYYSQLLSHYYLTHESEYFRLRDFQELHQHLSWGEGKVFLPDLKSYTLKVEAFRALGMLDFLEPEREFRESDADLILLKNTATQCSNHVKRALGINLVKEKEKDRVSVIQILSRLLNLLGLKLTLGDQKQKNNRIKVYKIDPVTLNDGREIIFEIWHLRDALILEAAKISRNEQSKVAEAFVPF
ncbi:MAG: plasmid replication protein, CyRepA1 family [Nostocaceae cyanobacterium]|nr:plasmid replication protein, CyRepA1 family [Nostocaceae cyanobacterium]